MRPIAVPILWLAACCLAPGCRQMVFEDRNECPSWVTLQAAPALDTTRCNGLTFLLQREGDGSEENRVDAARFNEGVELPFRKGEFALKGLLGWPAEWQAEDQLLIPTGQECPESFGCRLDRGRLDGESYRFPVPVTGLSVRLYFHVQGAESGYAFRPVVSGRIDGYEYPSFRLHEGDFHCDARPLSEQLMLCRIPRQRDEVVQADEDLRVRILIQDQATGEWMSLYDLPAGRWIDSTGYDWLAPVPEDIHLELSLADGAIVRVAVTVAGWTTLIFSTEHGDYII